MSSYSPLFGDLLPYLLFKFSMLLLARLFFYSSSSDEDLSVKLGCKSDSSIGGSYSGWSTLRPAKVSKLFPLSLIATWSINYLALPIECKGGLLINSMDDLCLCFEGDSLFKFDDLALNFARALLDWPLLRVCGLCWGTRAFDDFLTMLFVELMRRKCFFGSFRGEFDWLGFLLWPPD